MYILLLREGLINDFHNSATSNNDGYLQPAAEGADNQEC